MGIGQPLKVAVDRAGTVYVSAPAARATVCAHLAGGRHGDMEVIAGRASGCGYSLGPSGEAALGCLPSAAIAGGWK